MLDKTEMCAYNICMVRRTSVNLDFELVEEARNVLDARGTTDTIHRALAEVVRQARLQRLAGRRFDLRDVDLAELRHPRSDEAARVSLQTPG